MPTPTGFAPGSTEARLRRYGANLSPAHAESPQGSLFYHKAEAEGAVGHFNAQAAELTGLRGFQFAFRGVGETLAQAPAVVKRVDAVPAFERGDAPEGVAGVHDGGAGGTRPTGLRWSAPYCGGSRSRGSA